MQAIIVAKPYQFAAPSRGNVWPALLRTLHRPMLRSHGVERVEYRGVDRLRASVAAGHGILLAPNHCRPADPFVVAGLGYEVGRHVHIMASAHLFMQGWLKRKLLQKAGVFSIYREGLDREALKCAIQIAAEARRPLVLFPEGVISRHNDRLNPLMEGTAMIARSAAKQRAPQGGRVVVHPVAVRYIFEGDLDTAIAPMLTDIESRLTWTPAKGIPRLERIAKIAKALLDLKECEFFGAPQVGAVHDRVQRLIDHLLCPLEDGWLKGKREVGVVARVKALRCAVVPDLVAGALSEPEKQQRWEALAKMYLAQQLAFYPEGYLENPTTERILETVERFEEDLTDKVRVISPLRALVDVGEAIEVSPERTRGIDPLMASIQEGLETMLAQSLSEQHPGAVLPHAG